MPSRDGEEFRFKVKANGEGSESLQHGLSFVTMLQYQRNTALVLRLD